MEIYENGPNPEFEMHEQLDLISLWIIQPEEVCQVTLDFACVVLG